MEALGSQIGTLKSPLHQFTSALLCQGTPLETSSSSPICSAISGNRNHCPGGKDNHTGLRWAVLALLPGLSMGTPAEGGFALSAGLERGAANIPEPWIALPALLLHWSPPQGKVGREELQRLTGKWQLQLFGCPVRGFPSSQLPPLWFPSPGLCGCSL